MGRCRGRPRNHGPRAAILALCWRIARPQGTGYDYSYGEYGNRLPIDVLTNLQQIVKTDDDRAQAHFLMAMTLKDQGGDAEALVRVAEEFEAALKLGKKTAWYDDALYNFAAYLESYGRPHQDEQGNWSQKPDYVGALALYRRFLSEIKKGESRWYDSARSQADNIVAPELSVGVSNVFLPGSLLPYSLSWRNVSSVGLALYAVKLADVSFGKGSSSSEWLAHLDIANAKKVRSWTKSTCNDKHDYQPGSLAGDARGTAGRRLRARRLQARALQRQDRSRARDLVLITRTTRRGHQDRAQGKTILWVVDATTGEPRAEAKTTLWTQHYRDSKYWWTHETRATDATGVATFPRPVGDDSTGDLFAAASSGADQAFSPASSPSRHRLLPGWLEDLCLHRSPRVPAGRRRLSGRSWRAFYEHGDLFSTPTGRQAAALERQRPPGLEGRRGRRHPQRLRQRLRGELKLTDKMPLGEYRLELSASGTGTIGNAVLLRLEEYKLPEFTVAVKTPSRSRDDGRRTTSVRRLRRRCRSTTTLAARSPTPTCSCSSTPDARTGRAGRRRTSTRGSTRT